MKTTTEIFKETLDDLGFAGYKPDQMTNSDYWMCTCTAMEKFALEYGQALLQKAANSEHTFVNGGSIVTFNEAEKIAILNTKLDLI